MAHGACGSKSAGHVCALSKEHLLLGGQGPEGSDRSRVPVQADLAAVGTPPRRSLPELPDTLAHLHSRHGSRPTRGSRDRSSLRKKRRPRLCPRAVWGAAAEDAGPAVCVCIAPPRPCAPCLANEGLPHVNACKLTTSAHQGDSLVEGEVWVPPKPRLCGPDNVAHEHRPRPPPRHCAHVCGAAQASGHPQREGAGPDTQHSSPDAPAGPAGARCSPAAAPDRTVDNGQTAGRCEAWAPCPGSPPPQPPGCHGQGQPKKAGFQTPGQSLWVGGQLLASCPRGTSSPGPGPAATRPQASGPGLLCSNSLCPVAPGPGSARRCLGDRGPWRQSWRSASWPSRSL